MTSMVEKVARAIYPDYLEGWHTLGPDGPEYYKKYARKAIEALMEPTPEMIKAGEDNADGPTDVGYIFVAMIHAALKEGGQ